jgi:hypothetical protein
MLEISGDNNQGEDLIPLSILEKGMLSGQVSCSLVPGFTAIASRNKLSAAIPVLLVNEVIIRRLLFSRAATGA